MSQVHAKEFIGKLKTDHECRERLVAFIKNEGFTCTLNEIRLAEWEAMMMHFKRESNDPGKNGSNPYTSRGCGYEHWGG